MHKHQGILRHSVKCQKFNKQIWLQTESDSHGDLRSDLLPLWAGRTQGVFIKGLHVGIKLIVWLCPASKEAFLNLPHKKPCAYHSAAANRNKESTIARLCTFQTGLFADLGACFTTCIFTFNTLAFSNNISNFSYPEKKCNKDKHTE